MDELYILLVKLIMLKNKKDFDRNMSWYIFNAYLIYTVDAQYAYFFFQFGFKYFYCVLISLHRGFCSMLQRSSASYWDKGTE
jgi:hypothetical protein